MFLLFRTIFAMLLTFAGYEASAISYCKFLLDPPVGFQESGPGVLTDLVEASHEFSASSWGALEPKVTRELIQLIREAGRLHFTEDLSGDQLQLFQQAIFSVEAAIVKNLRAQVNLVEARIFNETLQLLASVVRLLAPKVADDVRVEIGKILINQLQKFPELGIDILHVLKAWRYRPNVVETAQVMRFMLLVWQNQKISIDRKIRIFSTLPGMMGSIPDLMLKPFVEMALRWAQDPASGLKYEALLFMWTLLELNPKRCLSIAKEFSRISSFHLPMPHFKDFQVAQATQALFIYQYFLKVLKAQLPWFKEEIKKFSTIEPEATHPTFQQFRLYDAITANGVEAYLEYRIPKTMIRVDLFIPLLGAKGKIIEVDGKNHYLTLEDYSKQLIQTDVRRDELLREMGYVVQRISNRQALDEANRIAPPWARNKAMRSN